MDELPERDLCGVFNLGRVLNACKSLHWDDAVRILRQHGAGHDLHALSGSREAEGRNASSLSSDDLEASRAVLPVAESNSYSIHRDSIERRLVSLGDDLFVEHGIDCVGKRQRPLPECGHVLRYQAFRVGDLSHTLSLSLAPVTVPVAHGAIA